MTDEGFIPARRRTPGEVIRAFLGRRAADRAELRSAVAHWGWLNLSREERPRPGPIVIRQSELPSFMPVLRPPAAEGDPAPPWPDAPEPCPEAIPGNDPEPAPESEPALEGTLLRTWKPGDPGDPPTVVMQLRLAITQDLTVYLSGLPAYDDED